MVKFEVIRREPGEVIRSEEWNKIQEDVKADLKSLEEELKSLKRYIDNLGEGVTLINLDSSAGKSYGLDETVPNETNNYATRVMGQITRQWVVSLKQTGLICRFGIVDFCSLLYYWSGAASGDKKALEISLEYMDGTTYTQRDIFIHEWSKLRPKGTENPYTEYLLSPNERVWYKYAVMNPNPEKKVLHVAFTNTNEECAPRIGNVIQYITKIKSFQT
jgi:hypothetical protein